MDEREDAEEDESEGREEEETVATKGIEWPWACIRERVTRIWCSILSACSSNPSRLRKKLLIIALFVLSVLCPLVPPSPANK